MRVLLLLALCFAAVAAVPKNPQRIVGGSITNINNYPYAVALLYSPNLVNYNQYCGGTILTRTSILTAAHCTFGDAPNRWRARVGSSWGNSGGIVHNVVAIINHPTYNPRSNDYDVGILRTTNINWSNTVSAGSIAGSNYNVADNQPVIAVGWGAIYAGGPASEQLRQVQVWTVNQNTCRARYAELGYTINDNMLCSGWLDVGGRDQCQGDSGGPLIHNGVIVGVCSWGESCALGRYPGVNARVSRFSSWIQNNA